MPELSVDIAVANRFISSLSKSLQALCHGCMEFDTGIEIIGYININIDSASISLPTSSQYQPRQRGSSYGAPFHRTSQFSPHSQVLHGSQKRQWGSDWRTSAKKHRPSTTSSETASFSGHTSYPSSSQTFTDTNFRQSSTPSVTDNKAEDDTEVINIKKEAVDTESEIQDHGAEQDQNNEDEKTDSSSKMKIKCDPDAAQPADIETDKDDTFSVKGSTDFKGTFLDPTHDASDEQNDLIDSEKQSETISKQRHSASDEHSVAGPSGEGAEESDDIVHGGENTGADLSLDYDQGNEDYPQSVHSDVGEASSDNGQFEVIEIDDEDEDVQAMFGDSQWDVSRNTMLRVNNKTSVVGQAHFLGCKSGPANRLNMPLSNVSVQQTDHSSEAYSQILEHNGIWKTVLYISTIYKVKKGEHKNMKADRRLVEDATDVSFDNTPRWFSSKDFHSATSEIPKSCPLCNLQIGKHKAAMARLKLSHQYSKQKQNLSFYSDKSSETSFKAPKASGSYLKTMCLQRENFPIQRRLPSVEKMLESSKFTRRLIGFVSQQNETSVESQCCSYCPEVLPDGFALQTHLKDVHGVTLPYICKQCGKGYNSPSGLYYHTQASHEKRSFLCPICDARFTRRSSINPI
ncbi:hypothetical protein Btru_062374 [Bulinus truncatus]|nr:hypothetical protein Btru_062374 [Bulinus truncatus]